MIVVKEGVQVRKGSLARRIQIIKVLRLNIVKQDLKYPGMFSTWVLSGRLGLEFFLNAIQKLYFEKSVT